MQERVSGGLGSENLRCARVSAFFLRVSSGFGAQGLGEGFGSELWVLGLKQVGHHQRRRGPEANSR